MRNSNHTHQSTRNSVACTIGCAHIKKFTFASFWFVSNSVIKISTYNIFRLVKDKKVFSFSCSCFHVANLYYFLIYSSFYQYIFQEVAMTPVFALHILWNPRFLSVFPLPALFDEK